METGHDRYRDLEKFLSVLIVVMLGLFILFLVMSANGTTLAKILAATLIFAVALFGLWVLRQNRELLRQRSIWMTLSFLCTMLCTLVSLLAGYPAP